MSSSSPLRKNWDKLRLYFVNAICFIFVTTLDIFAICNFVCSQGRKIKTTKPLPAYLMPSFRLASPPQQSHLCCSPDRAVLGNQQIFFVKPSQNGSCVTVHLYTVSCNCLFWCWLVTPGRCKKVSRLTRSLWPGSGMVSWHHQTWSEINIAF